MRSIRRTLNIHRTVTFGYRFLLKLSQSLRDQHLWVSIFLRPAHSFFTRVQRVACAMSVIMVSMVTNMMWYGHAESEDDIDTTDTNIMVSMVTNMMWYGHAESEDDIDTTDTNIEITREHIVIGLESLVITMSANILIVSLLEAFGHTLCPMDHIAYHLNGVGMLVFLF